MASSIWFPTIQVEDALLRANLLRFDNEEFGAGQVGYADSLDYADNTVGKALKDLFVGFAAVQHVIQEGYADIRDYGAVGDGITDCAAAFAAAMAVSDRIFIPDGDFLVLAPVIVPRSGMKITGANRLNSKLLMGMASGSALVVPPTINNIEFSNFFVGRGVGAGAGGHGIEFQGFSSDARIIDMAVEDQFHGISVRGGWRCVMERTVVLNCFGHGFLITPDVTGLAGWDMRQCFSAYNNGSGYYINGVAAGAAMHMLGELTGCYALYNTGTGLTCVGDAGSALQSVRLTGGAFTFNGADNIYLDTYSGRHRINNLNANAAGTTPTGRQIAQANASLAGNGIRVTANNQDVTISACIAQDNNYAGMHLSADSFVVIGSTCLGNGKNTGASNDVRSGMRVNTGRAVLVGNLCTNQSGTTTQQLGISATSLLAGSRISGNALVGNTVGTILVDGVVPQDILQITAAASPWTYTADGIFPETLYIKGGTIQSIIKNGVTLYTAASAASAALVVQLSPGESITITYTVVPIVLRQRKVY